MVDEQFSGEFWDAHVGKKQLGVLKIDCKNKPTLTVNGFIFDEKSVKIEHKPGETSLHRSMNAAEIVADFSPRTIWGQSDGGEKFTLLEAQGGYQLSLSRYFQQSFSAQFVLRGEHAAADQRYVAVRYKLDIPVVGQMAGTSASFVELGGGEITAYIESRGQWLEFNFGEAMSLRQLENNAFLAFNTLASIALRHPLLLRETQIRTTSSSAWVTVWGRHSDRLDPKSRSVQSLMSWDSITLDRVAQWVDLSARAETLVDAISSLDESDPIESQIITIAAVAEGIHRKLYKKSVAAFPELSKSALRSIRRVAKKAAIEKFHEHGVHDTERLNAALDGSLAQIGDVKFRARMLDLAREVEVATPKELLNAFQDWPKSVGYVRNKIVHQLDDEDDAVPLDREQLLDLIISVNYTLSWILRITLLYHAGFAPQIIKKGLLEDSNFEFAVANIFDMMHNHPHGAIRGQQQNN
ncbi:HEPN domain-containing protein [Nocardia sp. BMG51109]|uniref:HEPN domain-containing protein n=1 Tax=Nocardia sp. BMG51109 TaxID=1056816 RepID=UPI0012EC34EF|nr:HEPN domain-containing protein [Nocardia sp. BMG51109]